MRHSTTFLITLSLLLGGAVSARAEDDGYREFKSWQIICGQTRACIMRQFLSDSPLSSIELKRSGKPEAPVTITVSVSDTALTEGEGDAEATIRVDGGTPVVLRGGEIAIDALASSFTLTGDFIGSGLIEALKNGSNTTLTLARNGSTAEATFPLSGAAASLLFIDEYQDRVGHTDAMISKGDKAPNPPLPVSDITMIEEFPQGIRGQFAAGGACADTDPSMFDGNALAHKIDESTTIYITPCGPSGAYNVPYTAFVDAFDMVTPLPFPGMVDGAPSASAIAFNLGYDWKERTFSSFFKGRGIGDCGSYSEWKLAEGATGTQLALVEEAARDCPVEIDQNEAVDLSNWPKTWPLK
jgi:hypothetical protein